MFTATQCMATPSNLVPNVVYPQIKNYPSGAIEQIKHYSLDTQTGVTTGYYQTGEVKYVLPWENGKRHGEYREYDPKGNITSKHEYKNGVRKRDPIVKGITKVLNGIQNFFCSTFGPGD